ncbi:MAG: molybdate ABC transporter permease subunit [Gammaproteobacteria bacterium]|nr:molybdate ABC transporter permease subunit [Gammaproteobacteria bacterium]
MLSPAELEALRLSLWIACIAVAWALPLAIATAWLLARRDFPGRVLVDGLVHLPLVLPPVVVGYLLLITFGTRAPLGAWLQDTFGLRLVFHWSGAALAAGLISFPFQVRAIRLAMEAIDPGLHQAAESLGAGPLDRFISITLPLALPGILAGATTAFAASLGEFGAIITFVSNIPGETRTLPLAIYTAIQSPGGEMLAARLAGLSIVLALTGLVASELAARRVRALMAP